MNIATSTKITITGDLGSGKSATSAILCERTGFQYISTGRIQRQLAADMGMDTLEMNRLADTDPRIDEQIDSVFISLGTDPHGYVVDSRMAWFFLPNAFKVYLQTPVEIAADRILKDPTRNSENYKSKEEAIEKIQARKLSENARFLVKYKADSTNLNNFNLVIDTSKRSIVEVAEAILLGVAYWEKGGMFPRYI